MLSDRQNKFLIRMIQLIQENSSATDKERIYLKKCIAKIQRGEGFRDAVNDFNFALIKKSKERKKLKLSEGVKNLSNDLIDVYGEPYLRLKTDSSVGDSFLWILPL